MTPGARTQPKTRVVMQRPAGTYIVYLPGGRQVPALDEEHARRIVRAEASGSTPVFE